MNAFRSERPNVDPFWAITKHADILNTIRDTRDLGDDTAAKLKSVVEGYTKTFA